MEKEQSFNLSMSQINLGIGYKFRIFMKNRTGDNDSFDDISQ